MAAGLGFLRPVEHLAGEEAFTQSCEVNMSKYFIFFNSRRHLQSKWN
jgi:hypothetical protein